MADPTDRRQSERVSTRALVEVRIPTWEALQSVYTANLSLGGVRLSLPGSSHVPLGAALDMILTLPNGERLHLPGKVAYIEASGGDVGVRFEELSEHTRDELMRHLQALKEGTSHPAKSPSIPPGKLIRKPT